MFWTHPSVVFRRKLSLDPKASAYPVLGITGVQTRNGLNVISVLAVQIVLTWLSGSASDSSPFIMRQGVLTGQQTREQWKPRLEEPRRAEVEKKGARHGIQALSGVSGSWGPRQILKLGLGSGVWGSPGSETESARDTLIGTSLPEDSKGRDGDNSHSDSKM